jgi:hypothetical protein
VNIIPTTPQAVLDAIAANNGVAPWRPVDPEADQLTWMQLVIENWVPADFATLIDQCERERENLHAVALRYNLEPPHVRRD